MAEEPDTIKILTGDGASKRNPLSVISKTDWRLKKHKNKGEGIVYPAVFPELPSPIKRIYVTGRDLNGSGGDGRADMSASEMGLDRRPKTAIEVGLKWDF